MQKKNSKEIVWMLATASRFDAPKEKYKPIHFNGYHDVEDINPLLRNIVKRSGTLYKSCSKYWKIFKVCLIILRHFEVKG